MVCQAPNYTGGDQPDFPWRNWNGRVSRPVRLLTPTTLGELVRLVAEATDEGGEVHALGSGWAFEDLATSADRVISLAGIDPNRSPLPDVVGQALTDRWRARHDDPLAQDKLAHVHAGLEIGAVNELLAGRGLAMRTLGGANGQALAGAFSTSTHGGDVREAPLPDQVKALHLVTVGGQELWIEPASEPITTDARLRPLLECAETRIVRDDSVFHSALVAAGRFGVIYSVVVHVRPAFKLAEWTTRLPRASVLSALSAGVDAGTGLTPLAAMLPAPPADLQADTSGDPHFFQLLFNSQDPGTCLIQRRWPTTGDDLWATIPQDPLCLPAGADVILTIAVGALRTEAAVLALIPIVGIAWSLECLADAESLNHLIGTGLTAGEALARTVNLAWKWKLGHLVPLLARNAIDGQFKQSELSGRRGPGYLLTSGTRAASHSDCYRADSIEVIFPADRQNHLRFLQQILDAAPGFHQVGYVSVRYGAPSRALLSMHNLDAPMVLSIEAATMLGLEGNQAWMTFVEQAAIAQGGRPHWGQENALTEPQVTRLYGGQLVVWREALYAQTGTSTLFSNAYTRQRGLEPAGIVRRVTRTRKDSDGDITHLCGAPDARWEPVPVAAAIEQIRSGTVVYVTSVNANDAYVRVVDAGGGRKYLRSQADPSAANNLDALPDC